MTATVNSIPRPSDLVADKRLASELAMNGVLPFEDWVSVNTGKAKAMFGNQGVQPSAMWLAALHPRAFDYLEQAPVLALAASFGGKTGSRAERAYVAMNFKPLVARGTKLKDVMKAFRVAYPLRAVSAKALRPGVWTILQAITRLVDPSSISQAIPTEPTRHKHWLGDLDILWSVLQRRDAARFQSDGEILRWAMLALARHGGMYTPDVRCGADQIGDFLICNRDQWNVRWTWDRLLRETDAWHDDLAKARFDRINDGTYDTEVDYGRFPVEVTLNGFDFHALRSLRALVIEGQAMHHCVASYYPDIRSGRARIYSIRQDGKRIATVEFSHVGALGCRIAQIKGVCNARPPGDVIAAAELFAQCMAFKPNRQLIDRLPPSTRDAFLAAGAAT